ncbi:glycosyltransferase family 4 protein [Saprospira sp. CCB-QB6]|uniref:glycosyltransferase family 4 protein n=1 Tax=Saprospira sp. CCB-QB6 TaxID=3023936 RepID=UPI00234A6D30|nr:glycosyltransferase family 4 protein [Saprospira sp. CCB-QB6]WCL82211.1 glycosyltransferase family 4 protein [Saprospira sp. CCB-QB6]
MKRILFVALHRPNRSPSQRFRYEQYLDFLQENGYEYELCYLIEAEDDPVFYGAGQYLGKMKVLLKSVWRLWRASSAWAKRFDLIYVQREAFMLGTSFFERRFAKRAPLVFDFDDSIWLQNVSANNKALGFLKNANKTAELIALADMVFAGNRYLADYAKQYNECVKVLPTTVDEERHHPKFKPAKAADAPVCIGWTGSFSTVQYFEQLLPVLRRLKEKYGDKIYFKLIGDANYRLPELDIQGVAWTEADEIEQLVELDIGLMPLPTDEWTKGKCGLKGLQYMALGLPAVMSAVGVNTEIIKSGVNGFLAANEEEWFEQLSALIESSGLREKLGKAGRQSVLEEYAVVAQKERYLAFFDELVAKKKQK